MDYQKIQLLQLTQKNEFSRVHIPLPSSKSESNRALVIDALTEGKNTLSNLAEARDTQTMIRLLHTNPAVFDVLDAGTTMRFLTAFFATQHKRTTVLSGSKRMHQRPIKVLVEALRDLGAEISYIEKEGFPPLKIIGKQIKQIENLVNEFSDFARMPKPILKNNNLVSLIKDNVKLINELDNEIIIDFKASKSKILLNSDSEQLSRVFFNLIKNSIESIQDKKIDNVNFNGKIDISINENEEIINFIIIDNGLGFGIFKNNIKDILNPYFTTKKKGTGLGLSIVNKIINDHNGKINFISLEKGAKIEITFTK